MSLLRFLSNTLEFITHREHFRRLFDKRTQWWVSHNLCEIGNYLRILRSEFQKPYFPLIGNDGKEITCDRREHFRRHIGIYISDHLPKHQARIREEAHSAVADRFDRKVAQLKIEYERCYPN
jgi:hypothetical protein